MGTDMMSSPLDGPPTRRAGIANQLLVFCIIFGLCATWVMMSEFIQGMQEGWQKPWFILYVIHTGYALNLVLYWVLYGLRTRDWLMRAHCVAARRCCCSGRSTSTTAATAMQPYPVPTSQLVALSTLLSVLSAFVGYAWYLSLNHTLASVNNAIYQSAAAVVFLLSWAWQGEPATMKKLVAVALAIGGVAIVILAPTSAEQNSPVQQTIGGYMWVVLSTAGYAVYEVVYSRFSSQEVRSWASLWVRGGHVEGAHGGSSVGDGSARSKARSRDSDRGGTEVGAGGGDGDSNPSQGLLKASASGGLLSSPSSSGHPFVLDDEGADQPLSRARGGSGPATHSVANRAEQSSLVIGLMGVWSCLLLWPMFFILNSTGVEPFVLPDARRVRLLVLNAALDAVYNALVLFGIQVSSPLVVSVGTILVVPATALTDYLMHGVILGPQVIAGALVIVASFLVLQLPWEDWVPLLRRR